MSPAALATSPQGCHLGFCVNLIVWNRNGAIVVSRDAKNGCPSTARDERSMTVHGLPSVHPPATVRGFFRRATRRSATAPHKHDASAADRRLIRLARASS